MRKLFFYVKMQKAPSDNYFSCKNIRKLKAKTMVSNAIAESSKRQLCFPVKSPRTCWAAELLDRCHRCFASFKLKCKVLGGAGSLPLRDCVPVASVLVFWLRARVTAIRIAPLKRRRTYLVCSEHATEEKSALPKILLDMHACSHWGRSR